LLNKIGGYVRKNISLTIFCIFLFSNIHAQSGWFPLKNGPTSRLFTCIYFINADTGFVNVLDIGTFRTQDGGKTWTSLKIFGTKFKFFNNNKLGFSIGGVWKTIDSGSTWTYEDLPIRDIEFPSDSIGYSVGLSSDTLAVSLGRTYNGGKTWSYSKILLLSPSRRVVDVHNLSFRDNLHGFVTEETEAQDGSGGGAFGYYTSDGGETWISRRSGNFLFLHDSSWLSTDMNGGIYKTENDFKDSRQVNLNKISIQGCSGIPEQLITKFDSSIISVLSVNTKSIWRSINSGELWYEQFCDNGNTHVDWNQGSISTPTNFTGYAVGIDTQIYKTIDGGGPPFTSNVKSDLEKNSVLSILSNPISTSADFQFDALKAPTPFELFDALGRTLYRKELSSGQTSLHLDMQKYPAGIYFARLGTV
jgi:hypothetical protein